MSKIDNLILNDIKMLSLDMMKEAGSGEARYAFSSATTFYSLFLNHLKYDLNNDNWINRDRLFISNKLLPIFYSTMHMFGIKYNVDNLRDYKKLDSKTPGYIYPSSGSGDIIGYAVGSSLGERYLSNLVKIENNKSDLIDFRSICICSYDDLMSGVAKEALSFVCREKLGKVVIIAIKDKYNNETDIEDIYKEDPYDYLEGYDLDVYDAKSNNFGSVDSAIGDAISSKNSAVVLIDSIYDKEWNDTNLDRVLTDDELNALRLSYKMESSFEINIDHYSELNKIVSKRLNKVLEKWNTEKEEAIRDIKLRSIIEFLDSKEIKIDFNIDNLKLNDEYEEDLSIGNGKIFNIMASKSPYILCASDNNFDKTLVHIKKSGLMSHDNPTNRNIDFASYSLAMGSITCGLATLGFKVFVGTPLMNAANIRPFIKYAALKELNVNYIFTHDTFLNTYDDIGFSPVDEINSLRLIPKLITFRPADINEIIGTYSILSLVNKCCALVIGSRTLKMLKGTNPKYVVAGAYRVKREKGEANGIIIATGTEVATALKLAEELFPYGIDLRVVSMPCQELFKNQSERYKWTLLPKELKTFVLEHGSTGLWSSYATSAEYVLGIDKWTTNGTKEELLNKYNLNIDSLKTTIIELMKK